MLKNHNPLCPHPKTKGQRRKVGSAWKINLFTSRDPAVSPKIKDITNHEPTPWCKMWICCQLLQPAEINIINPPSFWVFIQLLAYGVEKLTYCLDIFFCWASFTVIAQ
jgi:hypothetical protein